MRKPVDDDKPRAVDSLLDDTTPPSTTSNRPLLKAILLLVLGAVALLAVYLTPMREYVRDLSSTHVQELGWRSYPAFILLTAAFVAIGAPRLLFATLGGAGFNFVIGSLLAQVGTVIGCYITYLYGRYLGHEYVEQSLRGRFKKLDWILSKLDTHGIAGNLLIRTMPVGNNFATNLILAVSPIRTRSFLIGTALGTLPGTIVYALLGSGAQSQPMLRTGLSVAIFTAWSILYAVWLRRTLRQTVESD